MGKPKWNDHIGRGNRLLFAMNNKNSQEVICILQSDPDDTILKDCLLTAVSLYFRELYPHVDLPTHLTIIKMLLEKIKDINVKDWNGNTAIDLVLERSNNEIAMIDYICCNFKILQYSTAWFNINLLLQTSQGKNDNLIKILQFHQNLKRNTLLKSLQIYLEKFRLTTDVKIDIHILKLFFDRIDSLNSKENDASDVLCDLMLDGADDNLEIFEYIFKRWRAEKMSAILSQRLETIAGRTFAFPFLKNYLYFHMRLLRDATNLLHLKAAAQAFDPPTQLTPLMFATTAGMLFEVDYLIQRCRINLNQTVPLGGTCFYSSTMTEATLETYIGDTALHLAIRGIQFEIACKLIRNGADFTIKNSIGHSALYELIHNPHVSLLKDLFDVIYEINKNNFINEIKTYDATSLQTLTSLELSCKNDLLCIVQGDGADTHMTICEQLIAAPFHPLLEALAPGFSLFDPHIDPQNTQAPLYLNNKNLTFQPHSPSSQENTFNFSNNH